MNDKLINSQEVFFYHALQIDPERCIGCSHCMRVCTTEAIRIRNGKAVMYPNRCIDCGQCYDACPTGAIFVAQDDFESIFNDTYQYKVVLLPGVFIGQFNDHVAPDISSDTIYKALKDIGFTHVFEVEQVLNFLIKQQAVYAQEHKDTKPLISTFCPAVVRLIQVKFPSLTENLVLMKQALDIAGMAFRETLKKEGASDDQIGVFYITPCAAKIAAVKNPVGEEKSPITGVINMNFIFNKVLRKIKEDRMDHGEQKREESKFLDKKSILWSLNEGESVHAKGRSLAIDGIEHVSAYLEKLEDMDEPDIAFLELRACEHGCAGGILTSGLRFLIADHMKKRSKKFKDINSDCIVTGDGQDLKIAEYLKTNLSVGKVLPRSMMKLDNDISLAMKKMAQIREMMSILPQKDCGVCGAPTCSALAEDIASRAGEAEISDCVFMQTLLEKRGSFRQGERVATFEKIWGVDFYTNPLNIENNDN